MAGAGGVREPRGVLDLSGFIETDGGENHGARKKRQVEILVNSVPLAQLCRSGGS